MSDQSTSRRGEYTISQHDRRLTDAARPPANDMGDLASAAGEDGAADSRRRGAYRPVPHDFVERWPQVGWSGAEVEWRAHARNIAQWVDECGRDRMVLARKAELARQRGLKDRSRRKAYVLGRTLSPVGKRVGPPPTGDGK